MNKYTTIPEFLADLDETKKKPVDLLRSIIKDAHPGLTEHIKWNAPSFVLDGEDRVTLNLQNKDNELKLIIHLGATRTENKKGEPIMPDDSGLISWQSDIRGVLTFPDLASITSQQAKLRDIVARWLAIS